MPERDASAYAETTPFRKCKLCPQSSRSLDLPYSLQRYQIPISVLSPMVCRWKPTCPGCACAGVVVNASYSAARTRRNDIWPSMIRDRVVIRLRFAA
jgi:hypothetical protein